ncbi:unnamed protein product [Calicophoron daubneyi]|uniref:non-specific serine/threonine protein kinase n=1 Tax=Calicophoron daubneyi TaxID=300641 RepID=A0AAV2TUX7_CALDB
MKTRSRLSFGAINEMSQKREGSWFGGFLSSLSRYPALPNLITNSSSLIPRGLLGAGCNSAVWAAKVVSEEKSGDITDDSANELAVKVLYNYYANTEADSAKVAKESLERVEDEQGEPSVDWLLLRQQIERESELRPSPGHPNIVPLVGHFVDRAPASLSVQTSNAVESLSETASESITVLSASSVNTDSHHPTGSDSVLAERGWCGAESFPEGFGGRPLTYYLLMPKFDATLDDLFNGTWYPTGSVTSGSRRSPAVGSGEMSLQEGSSEEINSSVPSASVSIVTLPDNSSGQSSDSPSPVGCGTSLVTGTGGFGLQQPANSVPRFIDVDEAVAILAQIFDAVAELELHGIAHRDIKPNNILLRRRLPTIQQRPGREPISGRIPWIDDKELLAVNTPFHVALTDFGCAIRTSDRLSDNLQSAFQRLFGHLFAQPTERIQQPNLLTHSGNTLFLAPEIATFLQKCDSSAQMLRPADYARSDIWAVATLAYPLFGLPNPFANGTLCSADYEESDLPSFPDRVPGVITWVVTQCLRRDPSARPPADLVADVLHTWCLLRHTYRRHQRQQMAQTSQFVSVSQQMSIVTETGDSMEASLLTNSGVLSQQFLDELNAMSTGELNPATVNRLRSFLNVWWAADWLTGPGRPPDGLRISFYRRVTVARLALCLRIVTREEDVRAHRITSSIAQAVESITPGMTIDS